MAVESMSNRTVVTTAS